MESENLRKIWRMSNKREPAAIALARTTLTRIGAHMTQAHMYWLERVMSQLEVGRWFRANGFPVAPLFRGRNELYAAVARNIASEQILYLEFGVYMGNSMRSWLHALTNPASEFHGFDGFTGLPETWNIYNPQGKFDAHGFAPRFDDPRVRLHIGFFQDTLPSFALPQHERLIIHLDADLYSSTAYVLTTLRDAIRPGTILIFDEFYDRLHELRAFSEFLSSGAMTFRFLGGATNLSQCAFERVS